ncbi:MAG: ATP-binding cassette domain-containing protein [Meiothermus sp.]|uniref:ATP-binding cassette domain-containing protein n=1 Tax=Meiothermus sp. TaxID=1955249 RepID=UPI0025FF4BFB|nr:ATP-binding cassette domain-containing protein [Meiothermus sp.]MCS7058884.1 ATP-binding cassette domain-containing protein [Meiothermus sp.]MCS7193930.1 ATP-binding cassette domain-containing protein [Meiothermus sp.]MDW8091956.1 ATP-binding cassette domain-containing protein [Meiothermus sp.]
MTPLVELRKVSKYFGPVVALKDIDMKVYAGEVHCLLGDNGAGKSTLIKTLSGVYPPSEGQILLEGEPVVFNSPRDALDRGIATVYQDLAMLPLMSIARNFFLGREPKRRWGPFTLYDAAFAARVAREELRKIGINIRDPDQPVGTLSGGERQSVAIARAVYFGAKVLILDEPTSALGVKESAVVLRYIVQAKLRGLGVIFITHNVHHAWAVGDTFTVLNRGRSYGTFKKAETTREQLLQMMAGGEELEALSVELELIAKKDPIAAAQVEQRLAEDLHGPN